MRGLAQSTTGAAGLAEPFALPPLMFVEEHGAKLGEPVGWVFERPQDDRALVDRQREQLHVVVASLRRGYALTPRKCPTCQKLRNVSSPDQPK